MLRTDRLAAVTGALADRLEAIPRADLEGAMPPEVRAAVKGARLLRVDLIGVVMTTALQSLRRLPDLAAEDPERAETVSRWAVHAVAYLTDQTDDPPPAWPAA